MLLNSLVYLNLILPSYPDFCISTTKRCSIFSLKKSKIRQRAIKMLQFFLLCEGLSIFCRILNQLDIKSSKLSAKFHQSMQSRNFVTYKSVEPFQYAAAHFIRFIHIQFHLSSDRLSSGIRIHRIPSFFTIESNYAIISIRQI